MHNLLHSPEKACLQCNLTPSILSEQEIILWQKIQPVDNIWPTRMAASQDKPRNYLTFPEETDSYQKSFTRSHETADIYTNAIPHSSLLNTCHGGFGQAQKIAFFHSSVKIFLKVFN